MIKLTCQDNCESEITVQLPPIGGGWATYSCPNCGNSHELLGDEETEQAYSAMNICGDCLYPATAGCTCADKPGKGNKRMDTFYTCHASNCATTSAEDQTLKDYFYCEIHAGQEL